jgi:hypothetical protein
MGKCLRVRKREKSERVRSRRKREVSERVRVGEKRGK